jgi:hypothetical protein
MLTSPRPGRTRRVGRGESGQLDVKSWIGSALSLMPQVLRRYSTLYPVSGRRCSMSVAVRAGRSRCSGGCRSTHSIGICRGRGPHRGNRVRERQLVALSRTIHWPRDRLSRCVQLLASTSSLTGHATPTHLRVVPGQRFRPRIRQEAATCLTGLAGRERLRRANREVDPRGSMPARPCRLNQGEEH